MTIKYFYDFEFEENGSTIIPISLGIVSEDNRELYLINANYFAQLGHNKPDQPSQWLKQNVINPIALDPNNGYAWTRVKWWPQIVLEFISDEGRYTSRDQIELWGYYAAYDHVSLAQLWGPMINLPEPIPMFTHEIMQLKRGQLMPQRDLVELPEHNALADALWQRQLYNTWIEEGW